MKSTGISSMQEDRHSGDPAGSAPISASVVGVPEMARRWPGFSAETRRGLLAAAGGQWFDWWQAAVALDEVPPAAWGWRLGCPDAPLSPAGGVLPAARRPLSSPRLAAALGAWLNDGWMGWGEHECRLVIDVFARRAAMSPAQCRRFARRVAAAGRSQALAQAREAGRDVLRETEYRCRQAVDCRAIWLPDARLPADELRHAVEASLHAPGATALKQSDIAWVVHTRLLDEDVVVKRHRLSGARMRLKYAWRISRARRAWVAGLAMRRLGLPVAEPLGLLEIMRRGRVTDSYIVTRWLPDCRTAGDVASRPAGSPVRRRLVETWRAAWLQLLDRGVYHADTKLSNAMVQAGRDGKVALYWTDLECLSLGRTLTGYRVLRNIVQMNGSLASGFTLRERLRFLCGLPPRFRWLRNRGCLRLIAWWTARRARPGRR